MHLRPTQLFRATISAGIVALALLNGGLANAQSASTLAARTTPDLGPILTDQAGRTVYLYTKDAPGISNCYDQCAINWPPLLTQSDPMLPPNLPGSVGSTARTDGGLQVTYNGAPLYYWVKDAKAGDTTGQNVGGVWFVINPAPAPTVEVRSDPDLGNLLVDTNGMSLYLYAKDEPGVSTCYDQCATAWPPLLVDGDPRAKGDLAAGLGTTNRDDGSLQVTYNGAPLYYWFKDSKPGDTTGQNVGNVWFVVNP